MSSSQSCFPSRPVDHYVCPMPTEILPAIVLIFSYNCKWKRQETRWFHTSGSGITTALAEQVADGPLTMKSTDFANGDLVSVEGCPACLGFTGPVIPGRDEGTYFVKVVVDNKNQTELTSHQVKIHTYDSTGISLHCIAIVSHFCAIESHCIL